jgi:hypothetical protein
MNGLRDTRVHPRAVGRSSTEAAFDGKGLFHEQQPLNIVFSFDLERAEDHLKSLSEDLVNAAAI